MENLAYVIFRSPAADEWRTFGTDIIGGSLADDGPNGAVRVRLDARPWRIQVEQGERDQLVALGWNVGADDFDRVVEQLAANGCTVDESSDLATERQAGRAAAFVDPFGTRHELVADVAEPGDFTPDPALHGSFVTEQQGMGHIVMMLPDLAAGTDFITQALGLRLSDTVDVGMQIRFFHCPGTASRHHSLAISEVPGRVGVHHIMVELTDLDDVGRAFDRARAAGHPISMDYGRHPNDLVTSFYVRSPSGFDVEIGTGGLTIDDETWETEIYDTTSLWGHKPPADGPLRPGILDRLATEGA